VRSPTVDTRSLLSIARYLAKRAIYIQLLSLYFFILMPSLNECFKSWSKGSV